MTESSCHLMHWSEIGHFQVNYLVLVFQNEFARKAFQMKMDFDLRENEPVGGTHFHMNGIVRRLALPRGKRRLGNGLFLRLSSAEKLWDKSNVTFLESWWKQFVAYYPIKLRLKCEMKCPH